MAEQEEVPPGETSTQALATLCDATRHLRRHGDIAVEPLLLSWRSLRPALHPRAEDDAVDVGFIRRALDVGGPSLLRSAAVIATPHDPRGRFLRRGTGVLGEALAWACGLSLEAKKFAHGLRPSADDLRPWFQTPSEARHAIDALLQGGSARTVRIAPLSSAAPALPKDRVIHIVAGAGAWRVVDLLSPYARRLREPLKKLGHSLSPSAEAPSDDDVYGGMRRLFHTVPVCLAERRSVEAARDGIIDDGAVAVIRMEAVADELVDRRVRAVAQGLKRSRAVIVALADPAALHTILRSELEVTSVQIVVEGSRAGRPAWLNDAATDTVVPITGSSGLDTLCSLSLPSLALAPREAATACIDEGAFRLLQEVFSVRAMGVSLPHATVRVVTDDDGAWSQAACEALASLPSQAPRGR